MRGDHEKKSDRVRVHHEKERWGEFTIRKIDGMRVPHEKKSDGVRVQHQKQRWGESSPSEKGMALEFTMRKRAMGWEFNMTKSGIG